MGDIKIGNSSITLKLGSSDVTAAYIGSTLVYSGGTPPTPSSPKWIATYTGGTTSSAECDSSSAITQNEINLTDLETVEIGDCVTSIGNYAFSKCSGITSCVIGSGVTSIGSSAFVGCTSLTSIDIPDSVTTIGGNAFRNCSGLTTCTIGSGVRIIDSNAFNKCSGLTSITVNATTPPRLTSTNAFANTNDCPIYVPAASVNAYQSASAEWAIVSYRIQAIPNS